MQALFIFLSISSALAAWTQPVTLFEFGLAITLRDTFTDPVQKVTHILYTYPHASDDFIPYMIVSDSGKIISKNKLSKTGVTFTAARLQGSIDGRKLVAVLSAKNEEQKPEQYISQSFDSGQSWSDPILVPRPDDTQACWRLSDAAMEYQIETERVMIFYRRTHCQGSVGNGIVMATRPPGSSVFANEVLIQPLSDNDDEGKLRAEFVGKLKSDGYISIVYTFKKADTNEKHLVEIRSKDNGVTWTSPNPISANKYNGLLYSYSDYANQAMYLTYAAGGKAKLQGQFAINGAAFTPSVDFTYKDQTASSQDELNSIVVCGSKGYSMALVGDDAVEFDSFAIDTRKLVHGESPFSNRMCGGVRLTCLRNNAKPEVVAVTSCVDTKTDNMQLQFSKYME